MHRAWIVALALVAVVLSAPLFASGHAAAAPTTGTVRIAYPLNNSALGIEGTRIQLSVSNFVLDPNAGPCAATDHGRIRLYRNNVLVQETTAANTSLPSLSTNDTKLGAQLVCTDGSSFTPPVWHNITISVGEPDVKILNTGRPLPVSTAGVRLSLSVTRFALDPANYAGPKIPGAGHVHVLRNGALIGTSTAPFADIAGFATGAFNLTVELHNNDHSLLVTSTHPFGYNQTIPANPVVPSIRIVSPNNGQSVAASGFRLTVALAGIELDVANYGGTNVPGHGHMHYYLDGSSSLLATSTSPSLDLGTLSTGAHSIKAELHNNDHSLYMDATHLAGFNATVNVVATNPSITIVSPAASAHVSDKGFRISTSVAGFVMDPENYAGTNIPGHGHIHFYEGTTLLGTSTATWSDLVLGPGAHTIRAELRNNDHSPLNPAVSSQVTLTTGPSELKVLEPLAGATVSTLGFRMRFAISNFTLDSQNYAGTSIPGQGHIHVYLGTTLLSTSVTDAVVITGLSAGATTLRVELRNNNHSALATPVTATLAVVVGAPSITLQAPPWTVVSGQDLQLSWTVTGFVLDSAAFGGKPEAGRGHVHIFVDGTYLTATAATSYALGGLSAGRHNISVELYNNDHSSLPSEYEDEATVTVLAAAPFTVDATGYYGSVGVLAAVIVTLAGLLVRKGRKGPPKGGEPREGEMSR